MRINVKNFVFILLCIGISATSSDSKNSAENYSTEVKLKQILDKADKLHRSSSSYAEVEMQVVTAHYKRILKMQIYTRGTDKTFIHIEYPPREKGMATLRLGTKMWNYLPNAGKVMMLPPSMMMGSWMGSDFTNDDLVKESTLLDDYNAEFFHPPDEKKIYYYIKLTPKDKHTITVWDKIELIVDKKTLLPVKETYFDSRNRPMRVLTFSDVKKIGTKTIPTVMEMIPLNKEKNKTVIKYLDVEFDIKIPENIFTFRNLKKKR